MIDCYEETYQTKRCCEEDALIARLLHDIPAEKTLDLACGEGHFEPMLPGQVTGLDIDLEMLRKYSGKALLIAGSFTDFPQEVLYKKYNLVTNLFGVYGKYPDFVKMIEQADKVLAPDGSLFLVAFGRGREDTTFAQDLLHRWGHYARFTPALMNMVLRRKGFRVEYCFGMSATCLDWVSFLPRPLFRLIFRAYHKLALPDLLPFKFFRAHYVVVKAGRA